MATLEERLRPIAEADPDLVADVLDVVAEHLSDTIGTILAVTVGVSSLESLPSWPLVRGDMNGRVDVLRQVEACAAALRGGA